MSKDNKQAPQNDPGTAPQLDIDIDDSQITALQQQVSDLTEALQRERADATNIRRRHDEQLAGLKAVVKASVIRDLLPVIDNFERALKQKQPLEDLTIIETSDTEQQEHYKRVLKSYQDYAKGIRGIVSQFEKTLADIGVVRIKTVGEPFDPKWHEAVAMDEAEGTTEVVSEELQAGYAIGDEVIRHAMVKVTMQ